MKILCIILIQVFFTCGLFAQSVGINTTGDAPNSSAMLDVSSTTKGFLPPRMTYSEKTAIDTPPAGLIVWCSNCGTSGEMQVYNGSVWTSLSSGFPSGSPGAPSIGTATAGNGQASVSFTEPLSNGGSTIVAYTATSLPGGITGTLNQSGSGTITITGLTNGTIYTFTVTATNAMGTGAASAASNISMPIVCGINFTINHIAGNVAPVTKTTTYGTVTNIPGESTKCWITSNLGSDHQATAINDATDASAGWYWQFNRKQGYKKDLGILTPGAWDKTSDNSSASWEALKDPCSIELGTEWRIPTVTEWNNVDAAGNWYIGDDIWNSGLKVHYAGSLVSTDYSLSGRGTIGTYWSSNQYIETSGSVIYLTSGSCGLNSTTKARGVSIRCIRN